MDDVRRSRGPDSVVAAATDMKVSLLEVGADLVRAEVVWGGGDAADERPLDLRAIVAVADDLCALGAKHNVSPDHTVLRLETSVRELARRAPRRVAAVARRIHLSDAALVWTVTLAGAATDDGPFALVTQTQSIEGARRDSTEPVADTSVAGRSGDDREGADWPRAETARPEPQGASGRRDQIVAAAADLIARKGFAGASIREIADAAGLHVPTLYQYVASKDELLELVYSRTMAALQTDLQAEVAGCVTAEQKLSAAIAILVERGDRFRHRIGILNRELRSLSSPARARVIGQYRELLQQIARIVEAGVESGEFRPTEPAIAANLINAACDVWPLRQFAVGSFGVDAFGREVAAMFVHGLSAARHRTRASGHEAKPRRPRA